MKLLSGMVLSVSCLLLVAGCKRDEVREYSAPKEATRPPQALPDGHPSAGKQTAELPPTPKIGWAKLPAGWTEKPATAMRAASFLVESGENVAEVSVIPLPLTGKEVELVNMWRQQMQLSAVTDVEATKLAETVAIGEIQGQLYDMASEAPVIEGKTKGRILVGMGTHEGMSWFFKMTGEEKFVATQKAGFVEFLKGVSFHETASAPAALAAETPAAPAVVSESTSTVPQWTAPANWQTQPPGQMLLATFAINGDGGAATVTVSSFPGDVGGALANVNRWRGQLAMLPLTQADLATALTPVETGGGAATLADFNNAGQRLIGVSLPRGGSTWFFKLKGDSAVVAKEKDAFLAFLKSLKY